MLLQYISVVCFPNVFILDATALHSELCMHHKEKRFVITDAKEACFLWHPVLQMVIVFIMTIPCVLSGVNKVRVHSELCLPKLRRLD